MTLAQAELGYWHTNDPGEPTTGKPRLSVTDLEASILTALGAGRCVLEIGTGLGVSTRALATHALTVVTIDPDRWVHETIVPQLRETNSRIHAQNHRGLAERFDLAFIDGSHATNDVLEDIAFVSKHLRHHSLIVCHDARYENVRPAVTGPGWHLIETEHRLAYRYVS